MRAPMTAHGPFVFVLNAPAAEQFRRAAYLERAFHDYTAAIGCNIVQDEINCTEEQAKLIRAWWEEQRL